MSDTHTKIFPFGLPIKPLDGADIIRHLIGNTVHGPVSAFDVFERASQLRGKANEEQVALCVQSVLMNYHWVDGEDLEAAQHDIERVLGVSMAVFPRE
jgi:hypothetical protein